MKQRYNDLSHDLCVRAVLNCADGKWDRADILSVMEKYGGVPRELIKAEVADQAMHIRLEAAESVAYELEQRIDDLLEGRADDLDLDAVVINIRADGMTGKLREIANCSVMHQMLGHLVFLGLQPLLMARILPNQFASVPGRGQTGMMRKIQKYLRAENLGIRCAKKTDVHHAYGTAQYDVVLKILHKEIPNARWILVTLEALKKVAPDGHLIIGGYLDAWLFNFLMSYALRYVNGIGTMRRGKLQRSVRADAAYMDDFGLMGSRLASLRSATRKLDVWLHQNFGMELKNMNCEIQLMSVAQEHAMRGGLPKPPGLDMGGYRVHRTFTTVRRKIYVKVRKQYLRAWRQICTDGTVMICRAKKIISYYGYFKNTDSRYAQEKLHVQETLKISRAVVSAHDRFEAMMKGMNDVCAAIM